VQIVKGYSPTAAGLLLIPMVGGIMAGSIVSGQAIARTGRYRIFPIVGLALLVIGIGLLSQVHYDSSMVVVDIYAFIFGRGLGFNMQTLTLAVQNAVPPQDMGVATSSATFFRQMGGTLGTAVFLSVLFNNLPDKISAAFKVIAPTPEFQTALKDPQVIANPANAPVLKAIADPAQAAATSASALSDSSFINHLDPRLAKPFLIGFSDSIDGVFLLGAFVLLVGFVVVWFLPELKLRSQSGIDAARSQANGAGKAEAPSLLEEVAGGASENGHLVEDDERAPEGASVLDSLG